jgi:hypothetical protein
MQYHANPSKAGDFFFKEGAGNPGSATAVRASLFDDGDPLVDRECLILFCPHADSIVAFQNLA